MTAASPRLSGPPYIYGMIGGAAVLFFVAVDWSLSKGGVINGLELWGRDFVNLWSGGKLIRARDFDTLYDPHSFSAYQRGLFGPFGPHVFSYPPTAFPVIDLFSRPPYAVALVAWLVITGGLFIYAARRWWPSEGGPHWLAVLTPAALVNIWAGHYGFLLGTLFLGGWSQLDKRPILGGVLIGLMAIKPQLAVLIPLALVIRGNWRAIVAAAVTVGIFVLATGLIYGWQAWSDFLFKASNRQVSVIDAHGSFFGKMSASAATAILDLGGGWPLAIAGQSVLAILGVALVAIAARTRIDMRQLGLLVATCTFLILPYSLSYDLTVVMIAAWSILCRLDVPALDRRLALAGFLAPQIGILLALAHVPVMSLMLAALALAQFRVAMRDAAPSRRAVPTIAAAEH
jgi:hypothetical protein